MFEVVPKRIYVKNKDANGLFNDMGGKETFKKYEPIEEPVFFKNEEEPEKKNIQKLLNHYILNLEMKKKNQRRLQKINNSKKLRDQFINQKKMYLKMKKMKIRNMIL